MQLWEQGLIDLDAPANDYLRAYRLIPAKAGHRPATVRHLLTHTAGLPEIVHAAGRPAARLRRERAGRRAAAVAGGVLRRRPAARRRAGHPVPVRQPRPRHARPARRGRERRRPRALLPRAHLRAPRDDRQRPASPSDRVTVAPRDRLRVPLPRPEGGPRARDGHRGAASIYSTPRDMARYVAALLGGGANEHGSVLESATLATMFEPHYQPDPRIPGMGLAFFRVDLGRPSGRRAPGHAPRLPLADLPCARRRRRRDGLHERVGEPGLLAARPSARACSGSSSALPDDAIRTDIPQRPETWADSAAGTGSPARSPTSGCGAFAGAGVEVFVRGGQLMLRFLTPVPALFRGFPLRPGRRGGP